MSQDDDPLDIGYGKYPPVGHIDTMGRDYSNGGTAILSRASRILNTGYEGGVARAFEGHRTRSEPTPRRLTGVQSFELLSLRILPWLGHQ